MKKILSVIAIVLGVWLWLAQSRSFYCVGNNCVTVWRGYIIPGKYYGFLSPSDNYIRTKTANLITVYFSSETPGVFWVRDQSSQRNESGLTIKNNAKDRCRIIWYDSTADDVFLYKPNAKLFNELKHHANFIDIDLFEGYAKDKTGKKL